MRFVLIALLAATPFAPAFAEDVVSTAGAPIAQAGVMLRDAHNMRLGTVDSVKSDGSVGLIYESHYIVVPSSSLSMVDGKLVTTLTKAEISRM